MKKIVQTSFYISENLREVVNFLYKREEVTKIVFYKRAVKHFLSQDTQIHPRILITERSHPAYVKRNVLETIKFESDLKTRIAEMAKQKQCSEGQIIFQALTDYCALLLEVDSSGVRFKSCDLGVNIDPQKIERKR